MKVGSGENGHWSSLSMTRTLPPNGVRQVHNRQRKDVNADLRRHDAERQQTPDISESLVTTRRLSRVDRVILVRDAVASAMPHRERKLPFADTAQQVRQVLELFGKPRG